MTGFEGLLCLRWWILHSCMNRLKVAVTLAGMHLVLGYHIPCLSSPLWTRGRGEVLDFVCSHRPQRFTQEKEFPDAAASSKGRVLPRGGCRGGGNSGWWRPLHYHNHHHQHQVNKNRWGLCETVETRAGPLWQGGSHVRHMTPPCANLPPVLAPSGLRCAPQHLSILLWGPRGSAHLHLKNTNAKRTTGCAQINAF